MNPWLIVFIVLSLAHLGFAFFEIRLARVLTKPFLMAALLLYYFTAGAAWNLLTILAICFSLLGDVFLIVPEKKWALTCGLGSFLLAHVCYLITIIGLIALNTVSIIVGCIAVIIYAYGGYRVYGMLKDGAGQMRPAIIVYMATLLCMSLAALMSLLGAATVPAAMLYAGSLSFIVSDTLLAHGFFVRERRRSDFFVMLTYLLAQLLIVSGLLGLGA